MPLCFGLAGTVIKPSDGLVSHLGGELSANYMQFDTLEIGDIILNASFANLSFFY